MTWGESGMGAGAGAGVTYPHGSSKLDGALDRGRAGQEPPRDTK
eukprot:gene18250-24703_t